MKIIKNKFSICILLLLTGVCGYCAPPSPTGPGYPPLPIDENLILLALAGVLFGIHIIYKQNKKRPT
jgi:hypothetical protein